MEDVTDIAFIIFISVILVIGFLLNCCILMVYWKQKCFQTPVYIYIKNLASCMLITGGLILPQMLHDFTHRGNYFEGTLLCKLIHFFPAFCLFLQITFIWIISVERLIKTTRVSATVNPSHNSENFRKEKSQARKISVACWLMGLLVATPALVFFDIVYVLIEDDSGFQSGYSESNVSYFSPEYNICQSDCLYDKNKASQQLLYINNSRLETAKRALSNILCNISSKGFQSLDIAKFRIHKFKYDNPPPLYLELSHTYFFKALGYIPYGAVMNNERCGLASIDKTFTLIERPEKLLNDSLSSISSWVGNYEFLIGCNYVTSHNMIRYTILSLVFLFVLPSLSIFTNYALLSRFLIKNSPTYRHIKRRSFIKMICMIFESSFNMTDKKNLVSLDVNPTNIPNYAANLNNRSENNLKTDNEPSRKGKMSSHSLNSLKKITIKPCQIGRNANLNMPERKGNAIKSLFFISLAYCLTWLPFFVVFTIEVI
ncbi:unnamed protein product [Gordionus sp. m RMFG-2023]